jgi:hypothetical protein
MKKVFFPAACMLPVFLSAQGVFNLHGHVKGLKNDDKIFLIYTDAGKRNTDSATVQNGDFGFKGTLTNPVPMVLSLNKNPYADKPAPGEVPKRAI